ncbi:MAG: preprotein translocase subunit SecA [Gammaproteobacteria bacterium]|nr:preprotein translocase subunit SecA [Gammaproteobacteria bacterium]
MIVKTLQNLFGTKNSRELGRMEKSVKEINALEPEIQTLSDAELKDRANAVRQRLKEGSSLDSELAETFALVREASLRTSGERHYDVQLLGGMVLHHGQIAEMRTGEGKTLMATLAVSLSALTGKGVHIVTVNDYLARRDADWMRPIYEMLGISVGVIQSQQPHAEKQEAYRADVTYGTNHEFGFDYLRDNMAFRMEDRVQRGLAYAIVDEVDSILIDEARTPLIISGAADDRIDVYQQVNRIAPTLVQQEKVDDSGPAILGGEQPEDTGDFFVDEQNRSVELTERGHQVVEVKLKELNLLDPDESLYSASNLGLLHHVTSALKAHYLYKRDVDYMVQNGEIVIIDEHTGRAMTGRRWSEGIHQAVEAKERVKIKQETQTVASTTYQNYFRLYSRLAGMTGTAETEAFEFRSIYGLNVLVIPTHKPMIRDDQNDLIFLSLDEKYDAIVEDIHDCLNRGQPVLVGTTSIESSERLSKELNHRKIKHSVLNAKQHEREADIIAQAGRPGTITIATNMAGRGTDIVLGGNWMAEVQGRNLEMDSPQAKAIHEEWQGLHQQVLDAGGLRIIGTERHESRRIDNQLRGRAGRQGDPGSSRFYLSLDDNLLRLFATPKWQSMMRSVGLQEGEAIEAKMVNNTIERAQRKIEGRNFDIRKNLLEYDDVSNDQRLVIYQQRDELLALGDMHEIVGEMRHGVVNNMIDQFIVPGSLPDHWDIDGLQRMLPAEFGSQIHIKSLIDKGDVETEEDLRVACFEQITEEYDKKRESWIQEGIDAKVLECRVMLEILDMKWKEHLQRMDHLRQGIHLRAYAQKNPKQEFKRESFELFAEMLEEINLKVATTLSRIQLDRSTEERDRERELQRRREAVRRTQISEESDVPEQSNGAQQAPQAMPYQREHAKVGRNAPCPCGSGKKYKHCHGQNE